MKQILALALVLALSGCIGSQIRQLQRDAAAFRGMCVQGDQEACLIYNEKLLRIQALEMRRSAAGAALIGGMISRQSPPSFTTSDGAGGTIAY